MRINIGDYVCLKDKEHTCLQKQFLEWAYCFDWIQHHAIEYFETWLNKQVHINFATDYELSQPFKVVLIGVEYSDNKKLYFLKSCYGFYYLVKEEIVDCVVPLCPVSLWFD